MAHEGRLSESEIEEIICALALGESSMAELAREYGVTSVGILYHRDRNQDRINAIRKELKKQGKLRA